jgi:hypothetical protein
VDSGETQPDLQKGVPPALKLCHKVQKAAQWLADRRGGFGQSLEKNG